MGINGGLGRSSGLMSPLQSLMGGPSRFGVPLQGPAFTSQYANPSPTGVAPMKLGNPTGPQPQAGGGLPLYGSATIPEVGERTNYDAWRTSGPKRGFEADTYWFDPDGPWDLTREEFDKAYKDAYGRIDQGRLSDQTYAATAAEELKLQLQKARDAKFSKYESTLSNELAWDEKYQKLVEAQPGYEKAQEEAAASNLKSTRAVQAVMNANSLEEMAGALGVELSPQIARQLKGFITSTPEIRDSPRFAELMRMFTAENTQQAYVPGAEQKTGQKPSVKKASDYMSLEDWKEQYGA